MSQRIADASAKAARSFYALPRMTDNLLSTSLRQLTGLSGEVVKHSNDVKSFSSNSARQHDDFTHGRARLGQICLGADAFAAFAKDRADLRRRALAYQPCGMAKVEDVTTSSGDLERLWEASLP
jgi:hypothetical protein